MSALLRLRRGYDTLLRIFATIAAIATLAMMALVVGNIVGRYLFNTPVTGTLEITESLLAVIIFLAVAMTQYQDGHIRVSILTRRLSRPWARIFNIGAMLLGAAFFVWCSVASWNFALQSYSFDEQEWGSITFPLYPIKFVVFFGLALLAIQFALDALVAMIAPTASDRSTTFEGV